MDMEKAVYEVFASTQPFYLFVIFLLFFLCAFFCSLFLSLYTIAGLFLLLLLRIVDAHACDLVLNCHDGVAQEHAALRALHDREEFLRCFRAETRTVAAVTDGLRDSIGAAIHLRKDGCEECRTGGAQFPFFRTVVFLAVNAEGLADVFFFLRDVVLEFGWLALREEA